MSENHNAGLAGRAEDETWLNRQPPSTDGYDDANAEPLVSVAMVRGILFRRRYLALGILAVALLLGLIVTLLTTPIYKASATVQIDPNGNFIVQGQDLSPGVATNEISRYMETQAAVITSRKLAYRVVDALKLTSRPGFLPEEDPGSASSQLTPEQKQKRRREMATSILEGNVSVDFPGDSRIVTINYRSGNPVLAAAIANAYADSYVQEDLRNNLATSTYAQRYLRGQIDQVRNKLEQAELAANAYAKTHGIISPAMMSAPTDSKDGSADSAQNITTASLANVNQTYTDARTKRIVAQQRWLTVAKTPASQLPEVQQSTVIQDLLATRAKLAGTLADLRQRYGEDYPQIQELKAQITSLDRQIGQTSADIKNSIRNDFLIAQRQEAALQSELGSVAGQTLDEQDRRVHYNILDREAGALRTQLAALLDRYNQVASAATVQSGSITKLDAAQVPGYPSSPKLGKNLFIALVLGAGLAAAVIVLMEILDDRVRSPEDVENKLNIRILGQTPFVDDADLGDQLSDPFSPLMESYSSLRTAIDFASGSDHKVLQMTSSQSEEAKTTTAIVLGQIYARLGKKVLLVDADLRRPAVAAQLGLSRPDYGLAEVLAGSSSLESALVTGTPENLDVLACGPIPSNPVEILSSPLLGDFLARQRERYDVVIVDSSPLIGIADAPLLSRFVDFTVFVVEANRAHFGQAKTALRRLRNSSANVLGAVLTKFKALEAGQSYDYQYKYYSYSSEKS
ncbi:MAG: polysaccharide biosynthesis tyrosine autokinase [Novosphingobium sp.]